MIAQFFHWLIDRFVFVNTGIPTFEKFPRMESTDGQEPTAESRREEARKTDAQPAPARKPVPANSKALEQEFWNTL